MKLFSNLKDLEMTNCFEPYITLRGHSKPILSLTGSDSESNYALQNIMISGSSNGQIRMWKTPNCSEVNGLGENSDSNFCVQAWNKTHDGEAIWDLQMHQSESIFLSLGSNQ